METKEVRDLRRNFSPIEHNLVKTIDEGEVITSLKLAVLVCMKKPKWNLKVFDKLNSLVKKHGSTACQIIFQEVADLHFTQIEASTYWSKIYKHSLWLNKKLGRPIPLVAAICDYFSRHKKKFINTPKLTTHDRYENLINHSTIDHLTGLFNRNCFSDTLSHLLALTQREGNELSLVFFDLDDFKKINDTYGHQVGDFVLRALGQLILHSIRQSDIALRYGGEEFVVLMPNTDSNDALKLSNRIRKNLTKKPLVEDGVKIDITISGGVAVYPLHAKTADELIYFADSALYRAKGAGKNNVKVFKNENRHCFRVPFLKKLKVKEMNFDGASVLEGTCRDICFGGILFENSQSFAPNTYIQLNIELNTGDPTLLFGTVVRVTSISDGRYAIAVSFSFGDMERMAKAEISRLIEEYNGNELG